jgi:hypothetical protein
MKTLLCLLLLGCLTSYAQPDTLRPLRREELKPITYDLMPTGTFTRYGYVHGSRTQYMYDGLDIRAKALGPYIMASGDPTAIREFNAYLRNRQTGGLLIGGGIAAMLVGTIIMASNSPGADGKFTTQQAIVCPVGMVCGGSLGTVYGGQVVGYQSVTDTERRGGFTAGFVTLLTGGILTGIGWSMNIPGQRVRNAVQHYNRSLRQPGVSWEFKPYGSATSTGLSVAARF